jgi:neutral ceramidase
LTKLQAGSAKVCITPPLGVSLQGYYFDRKADAVLDDLFARALYVSDGAGAWVLISCDLIALDERYGRQVRERAAAALGLTPAQVMVACSHTHTGPVTTFTREIGQRDDAYLDFLVRRLAGAAVMAARQARLATLLVGEGSVGGIAFNRRYRMRDGSVVTNPGIGNPDAVEPMGPVDLRLKVALFRGDDGPVAVLTNYALHADMVSGTGISGDWPGAMARIMESRLPAGCPVLFTNGAAGDINHIDVFGAAPAVKGYDQALRTGEAVAAEALAVLERLRPAAPGPVAVAATVDPYPLRQVQEEALAAARAVVAAGPDTTRDFTLEAVAAHRDLAIARLGRELPVELQAFAVGEVALVAIPGEPFCLLGRAVEAASPFRNTWIVELANDSVGYLPTEGAYAEGGYEVTSTRFGSGTPGALVARAEALLRRLQPAEGGRHEGDR